jgi:hypothetical protein
VDELVFGNKPFDNENRNSDVFPGDFLVFPYGGVTLSIPHQCFQISAQSFGKIGDDLSHSLIICLAFFFHRLHAIHVFGGRAWKDFISGGPFLDDGKLNRRGTNSFTNEEDNKSCESKASVQAICSYYYFHGVPEF